MTSTAEKKFDDPEHGLESWTRRYGESLAIAISHCRSKLCELINQGATTNYRSALNHHGTEKSACRRGQQRFARTDGKIPRGFRLGSVISPRSPRVLAAA